MQSLVKEQRLWFKRLLRQEPSEGTPGVHGQADVPNGARFCPSCGQSTSVATQRLSLPSLTKEERKYIAYYKDMSMEGAVGCLNHIQPMECSTAKNGTTVCTGTNGVTYVLSEFQNRTALHIIPGMRGIKLELYAPAEREARDSCFWLKQHPTLNHYKYEDIDDPNDWM
jgi:hypothetical protein